LEELGRNGQEAALICIAARLHDIGKVAIPDNILLKRGELTTDEQAVMQTHADLGAQMLAEYPDLARIVEMVRHHHERWDGLGYPSGLRSSQIPYGARVLAVAESFVAMTCERSYRSALSIAQATEVLRSGSSRQWDADIVHALVSHLSGAADVRSRATPGVEGGARADTAAQPVQV
jgi:putative two-component system response regulator